jgi:hypothetical protein
MIDNGKLERALSVSQAALKNQVLPAYMKKRWSRALEKASERLIKHPFFAWDPEQLLIVSAPKEKSGEINCRFYLANELTCRRVDDSGLCQAFFEGFPCWHRAAYLLLKIYFDQAGESVNQKHAERFARATTVNQS